MKILFDTQRIIVYLQAQGFNYNLEDILEENRESEIVFVRALVAFYLREKGYTYQQIGNALKRNHATIINLLKYDQKSQARDNRYEYYINSIRAEVLVTSNKQKIEYHQSQIEKLTPPLYTEKMKAETLQKAWQFLNQVNDDLKKSSRTTGAQRTEIAKKLGTSQDLFYYAVQRGLFTKITDGAYNYCPRNIQPIDARRCIELRNEWYKNKKMASPDKTKKRKKRKIETSICRGGKKLTPGPLMEAAPLESIQKAGRVKRQPVKKHWFRRMLINVGILSK